MEQCSNLLRWIYVTLGFSVSSIILNWVGGLKGGENVVQNMKITTHSYIVIWRYRKCIPGFYLWLMINPFNKFWQELDKWMNESADGVIYFSFGSMLRGATLPTDKVRAFLQVFESLPQRVLWKWEDDNVDKLPNNVKIMKWIPQRDVLGNGCSRRSRSKGYKAHFEWDERLFKLKPSVFKVP